MRWSKLLSKAKSFHVWIDILLNCDLPAQEQHIIKEEYATKRVWYTQLRFFCSTNLERNIILRRNRTSGSKFVSMVYAGVMFVVGSSAQIQPMLGPYCQKCINSMAKAMQRIVPHARNVMTKPEHIMSGWLMPTEKSHCTHSACHSDYRSMKQFRSELVGGCRCVNRNGLQWLEPFIVVDVSVSAFSRPWYSERGFLLWNMSSSQLKISFVKNIIAKIIRERGKYTERRGTMDQQRAQNIL